MAHETEVYRLYEEMETQIKWAHPTLIFYIAIYFILF